MNLGSCLLFSLIFKTYGYMLWNPHQLEYDSLKKAVAEAIDQEAMKKYDSPLKLEKQGKQINSHGSSHSLLPLWNHWSLLSIHSLPDLQTTTALPNLLAGKSKNAIFRTPWSSQAAFPVFQEKSNKIKANKQNKLKKLTKNGKKKAKKYSLCFLVLCTSRRDDVYYVRRKLKN